MFKKGKSGNPAGRPVGSGVAGTLRNAIAARAPELVNVLIQQALDGDATAAKFLLDRVLPPIKAVDLAELVREEKKAAQSSVDAVAAINDIRKRYFGLDDVQPT